MLDAIKKFYLEGYGMPKKYYTDDDLEIFYNNGKITKEEMEELKEQKVKLDND